MPDIFNSDVLVSVMQHYLDAKTLPVLFLWTVRARTPVHISFGILTVIAGFTVRRHI